MQERGQTGQFKANLRGREVRGSSRGGSGTRPSFRGKVYRVDEKKQNNVEVERNYDEDSTSLIELEKQLHFFDYRLSDDCGVNAIDDMTKESKLAEESKDDSITKRVKLGVFTVLPTNTEKKRYGSEYVKRILYF